ncbi:hypothetical protein [Sphaerisporangium sp. TRM90804]|uniref:hypothetical protein n=1 Tax=Sphaerisporangium sp. TRM90804 TaxID=3031113 RepID=UPI0024476685|nr:hypothetical protein [Sphaerisporangium sp. TRM90804]MDH2424818.1 hypothetical protein [Sphaerisporangium sp. TRM90804]
MTVDTLPVWEEQLAARVEAAITRLHTEQARWDRQDFASTTAVTLLQMTPPTGSGEHAAGIAEGLRMAARTVLRLAGVDTGQTANPDDSGRDRMGADHRD